MPTVTSFEQSLEKLKLVNISSWQQATQSNFHLGTSQLTTKRKLKSKYSKCWTKASQRRVVAPRWLLPCLDPKSPETSASALTTMVLTRSPLRCLSTRWSPGSLVWVHTLLHPGLAGWLLAATCQYHWPRENCILSRPRNGTLSIHEDAIWFMWCCKLIPVTNEESDARPVICHHLPRWHTVFPLLNATL